MDDCKTGPRRHRPVSQKRHHYVRDFHLQDSYHQESDSPSETGQRAKANIWASKSTGHKNSVVSHVKFDYFLCNDFFLTPVWSTEIQHPE